MEKKTQDNGLPTSLQALLEAPKGQLDYTQGQAFVLHVFWEAPSAALGHKLLSALEKCATATHRDTPCVPTYFFRISNNSTDLCGPVPRTVGNHPQLQAALRKLQKGIPMPAVHGDLLRRGLDPSLLELDLTSELPMELQLQPVLLEFTEVYLDERAFTLHAGSRDYLDAYGAVMQPELMYSQPRTIRFGTPPASMVERILEPMLHEEVLPVVQGCQVWQRPGNTDSHQDTSIFLSLEFPVPQEGAEGGATTTAAALTTEFREHCTTCLVFNHPMRPDTIRLMCVLSAFPPQPVLAGLLSLNPVRGEAHTTNRHDETAERVRTALADAGLSIVTVNASEYVGYPLHQRASDLDVTSEG